MMDVACGWHGFWPDCSKLPAVPNYPSLPYGMSIAQLRSLPTEVLHLHLQQRNAVLTGSAMDKAARLYEHLHPIGQSATLTTTGSGAEKQVDATSSLSPTTKKITEAVKRSVETMREDIVGSLLGNLSGTKSSVVRKLAGTARLYTTRGHLGRPCPSDVVS